MKKKYFAFILIFVFLLELFLPIHAKAYSRIKNIVSLPYPVMSVYASGNYILVGTKTGFFMSSDSGKTFSEMDKGLADLEITGAVIVKGKIFVGTANAGLYESPDMGKTWVSLMDKLNCPTISSVSTNGSRIFVTSLCTGFHYSDDLGETWNEMNGGLPTLRTITFLKTPQGRYFLGTDQYGLFFSDTLGRTSKWKKLFERYTITSLSYINNTLLIGTNTGIFYGNIMSDNFKKLGFIGGNPYIADMKRVNGKVVVAMRGFGLFATNDGKTFYSLGIDAFSNAQTMFFDKNNEKLYIGTSDGNVMALDLSYPFLVYPKSVDAGSVPKGSEIKGKIDLFNIGSGTIKGEISAPYFVKFSESGINGDGAKEFAIDTSSLSVGGYTEPIALKTNGGNTTIYLNFKVNDPSSVSIRLRIGESFAYVNSKKLFLDAPPFIDPKAGRTLVPVRFISEAFGAKVEWDPNARKVTIRKDPTEHHGAILIELKIGSKVVSLNLKNETIDVAPRIVPPGRTMVPLRFISEAFGSLVEWNARTREITILYTP